MLKRIDSLLIKAFLPPFFLAFIVALFVLIMQAIWLVIDDIMGKGVGMFMILEILGYMCVTLFPMALPIGILIASVMVFGNISERYELASMKSAGMSLIRIMAPLMIITMLVSIFSFVCSNYLIPVSNLKFKTRLHDIKRQKPTLSIQERVFNYDFSGMTLRVGKKHEDGQTIEDIMIYDQASDNSGNLLLTKADHGKMFMTTDQRGFVIQLSDGLQYQELKETGSSKFPFVKVAFKESEKVFDLTQFEMNRTDEEQHKEHYAMLNAGQLRSATDTLQKRIDESRIKSVSYIIPPARTTDIKTIERAQKNKSKKLTGQRPEVDKLTDPAIPFYKTFSNLDLRLLLPKLKTSIGRDMANVKRENLTRKNLILKQARHIYELHFKYASALICFIFLFIGAPMGAIIRKGGYGYPLLITILFFMLYMVLTISFKETMKVGKMDPFIAAWLPVVILIPIGAILTTKAMNDSKFLDIDRIAAFFRGIKEKRQARKAEVSV